MNKPHVNPAAVPPAYVGVWRRDLLRSPAEEDTRTRVFWLQTGALYADLRVPADRPDFTGIDSLAACSDAQLDWLAGQQGFAGALSVSGNRFHWHRAIDFQPDRSLQDIGRMTMKADHLLEEGVFAHFHEHWVRTTPESPEHSAHVLESVCDAYGHERDWHGYLLTVDDFFMLAVDRRGRLPQAGSLRDLCAGDRQRLVHALDMEISFGRLSGDAAPWTVSLSTLPFREGTQLFTDATRPASGANLVQRLGALELHWVPAANGIRA